MAELELAEAIGQLRREIGSAMQSARDEPLKFLLGPVELELQVQLVAKGGVKGEAKWVVVSFGAEASTERTSTHKVKLTLTPKVDGKGDIEVGDKTARPG
ncbi:MAG: trypco2 family protein [Caldimonas sp.]